MSCFLLPFLYSVGFFSLRAFVHGYSRECDNNRTIFTPEGSTVTFLYNSTSTIRLLLHMAMTSETRKGDLLYAHVIDSSIIDTLYIDGSWKNRSNISMTFHSGSDNKFTLRIDLNNVSMDDNGTYQLYDRYYACYILYVMRTRIEPSHSQEENEPIYVFAHPHASLIKRPLTNATMVWLLDGKSVNQSARFIQQDGLIWIPKIRRGLNGRNVTYRALHDDGRITDVNTTVTVKYGPSYPLTLVPRKTHYNLVSGDIMPDITCTSECNPQCNISWGEHSEREKLSLGTVTKEDSGEYTCTASRIGGQTIQQTVSIFVADRPIHFLIMVPRKTHYYMVSGDIMPDITCTSECNPPCSISWGEHSKDNILSLGAVTTEDTGEYTCTASRSDGRIVEEKISVFVSDRPLQSLKLSPKKTLYNLVSGDAMPDITCTYECNPPCIISWGEHSKDNILSLGDVTTEDTGEYTCTARRLDGRIVEQTVSVYVNDNSYFTIAITCLATVQSLTILAFGLSTFSLYKRQVLLCCHQQYVSKNKSN